VFQATRRYYMRFTGLISAIGVGYIIAVVALALRG
jgi:hypothetical protein